MHRLKWYVESYGDCAAGLKTYADCIAHMFPLSRVVSHCTGNVYIADTANSRIRVIALGDRITTFAGSDRVGARGDNGPATSAELNNPSGCSVDSTGRVLIVDTANSRIRVVSGGIITSIAGDGLPWFGGDNGPATSAQINEPRGVAAAPGGGFFIADTNNNRVRFVNAAGIITTVAGNGNAAYSGDNGPATSASVNTPTSVLAPSSGGFIIVDSRNSRIRAVSAGA